MEINKLFFLNGNLGKAFSLTKNTMNHPELNLLSTQGRKKLQFLTGLSVREKEFLCMCAWLHMCILDFLLEVLSCAICTVDFTFRGCLCVQCAT